MRLLYIYLLIYILNMCRLAIKTSPVNQGKICLINGTHFDPAGYLLAKPWLLRSPDPNKEDMITGDNKSFLGSKWPGQMPLMARN